MKFDFSKAKLSAEALKILNDPDVVSLIDKETDAGVEAQVTAQIKQKEQDFETSKNKFKANMDKLNQKLKDKEKELETILKKGTGDVDKDEFLRLKSKAEKLEGQLEALQNEKVELENKYGEAEKTLTMREHHDTIRGAIEQYNVQNKEWQVNPDSIEVVEMLAEKYVKKGEDGEYVATRLDGKPLTTAEGMGTPIDWLTYIRQEKPSLFITPKGSGAPGSTSRGVGGKSMSRAEFEALPQSEKAEAAENFTIVD